MFVNITSTFTFENKTNISYSNFTNRIDLQMDKEKNILQLLPYIFMVVFLLIIVIILCIKDKHQTAYIAAVKARKRAELVTWSV